MAEMEEPVPESEQIELHPCGVCGRTFQPAALVKHEKICLKNATQKRKPFNSRDQRVAGTELAAFYMKTNVKKSGEDLANLNNDLMALSSLNIDKIVNEETPIACKEKSPPKISKNKQRNSEIPVKGMEKAAIPKSKSKPVLDETPKVERLTTQKMEKPCEEPPKVSVTPKRSTSSVRNNVTTPQGEKCPSCDRTFGLKAYERHVEWCKARQQRPQASPASVQMAKERLAARTNYRAPIKKVSQRAINKEKYSSLKSESKCSLRRDSSVERDEEIATFHTSRSHSLSRQPSVRKESTPSMKRHEKKGGDNEKRVSTQHTNNNSESNEHNNSHRSNQQHSRKGSLLDSSASTISTHHHHHHQQRVSHEHDNNKANLSRHGSFDSPTPIISSPLNSGDENEMSMIESSARVKKSKAGSKPLKLNDVVVNNLVLGMTVTSFSKARNGYSTETTETSLSDSKPTKDGGKPRVATYKVDIIKKNIDNISGKKKEKNSVQFVSKKSEIPVRKKLVLAKDIEKALNAYKDKVMNGNGEMEEVPDFPQSGAGEMIMKTVTGVVDFLETKRENNCETFETPICSVSLQDDRNSFNNSTDYSSHSISSSLEQTVEMHEQKFSDACSNYDNFVKNINYQDEENFLEEKIENDHFDELQSDDYEFTEIDGRICMKKKDIQQSEIISYESNEDILNQTWPSAKNLENFRGTLEEETFTVAALLSPRNDLLNRGDNCHIEKLKPEHFEDPILDNNSNITTIVNRKICLYNDKSSELEDSESESHSKSLEESCENLSKEKLENKTFDVPEENEPNQTSDSLLSNNTEEDLLFEDQIKRNLQRYKEEFLNITDNDNIANQDLLNSETFNDEQNEIEEEPQRCVSVSKVVLKKVHTLDVTNNPSPDLSSPSDEESLKLDQLEVNVQKDSLSPVKRLSSESFGSENLIPSKRRRIDLELNKDDCFSTDYIKDGKIKFCDTSVDSLEERNPDTSTSSTSETVEILYVNQNALQCEEESGNEADISDVGPEGTTNTRDDENSFDSLQTEQPENLKNPPTVIHDQIFTYSSKSISLSRSLRSRSAKFERHKSVTIETIRTISSAKHIVFTKTNLDNQENISYGLNAEIGQIKIPEKFRSEISLSKSVSESSSNTSCEASTNVPSSKKTLARRKLKSNNLNETKSLNGLQKAQNIPDKKSVGKKVDVRLNKTACINRKLAEKNKNKAESATFRQDTFVVDKNIKKTKSALNPNERSGKVKLVKVKSPQRTELVDIKLKKNTIQLEEMQEVPKPPDEGSRPSSSELKKNVVQLPAISHESPLILIETIVVDPPQKLEKSGPKLPPLEISDTKADDPFITAAKQMQELLNLDLTPTFPSPTPFTRPKTAPCTPLEPEKRSNIILPDINKHKLSAPSTRKISKTNSNAKLVRKLSNANKLGTKKTTNESVTSPVVAKPLINVDELPIITKYTREHLTPGVDDPKEIEQIKSRNLLHTNLAEILNKNDKNLNNQQSIVDASNELEQNIAILNDNFEFIENLINESDTGSRDIDTNIDETNRKNEINLDAILHDLKIDESYIIHPDLINSVDNLPIPDELKSSDMYSLEYDKQIDAFENVSKTPPANVLDAFAESDLGALIASALGQISPGESAKSSNFLSSANPLTHSTPPTSQKNSNSYLKKSVSVEPPLAKPRHLRNKEDVEKFLGVKDSEKSSEKDEHDEDDRFVADELFDINDQLYEEYKQYEQMFLEEKRKSGKMGPPTDPLSTDEYLSDRSKNGNESLKPSGDSAYSSLNRSPQRYHSQRGGRNQTRADHCPSSSGSDISLQAVSLGQKSNAIHKSMLNSISNAPHETSPIPNELNDELLNTICDSHDIYNSNNEHKKSGIPTPVNSSLSQSTTDLHRRSRSNSISDNNNSSALQQRFSKFCHECGSKFPVTMAKFCVECGVKRLVL